jgi:hypothetical protein
LAFRLPVFALMVCAAAAGQAQESVADGTDLQAVEPDPKAKSTIASVVPAGAQYRPLTAEERWKLYVHETYLSPSVLFRAAGAAAGEQYNNEPPQWGQGMRGYARRTVSVWGRFTLSDTYVAAGSAALGHDVRYVRCRCSGFGPRLGYALTSSLFTRDGNGRIVPAVARMGGAFGAEYTARLWLPEGFQTDSRIARTVLYQVGFQGVFNALREFTPELKRAFRRK